MSKQTGTTPIETVRQDGEALRRQHFGQQIAEEIDNLRSDPKRWAAYLMEAEPTSVADGIG